MDTAQDPFCQANYFLRKAAYDRWHRQQSKQHILRSQLGFTDVSPSRPKACQHCEHYHGIAYGYNRANRTVLICGFHPFGWQGDVCPDWSELKD
ncbi:hypothetical protein H6F88_25195 [Oculatella sp. FACHB-28]|uniref:hypothetical protein n=1 Tax=Oculatella sp. FACHB-28 TaxID=2692845 RepID=UPI0016879781|nr:hypothetical protein [Oculatella sp. FACHB-28]MBD2059251.1 hypothetical protein [Oculatella sp. FACHB-28]